MPVVASMDTQWGAAVEGSGSLCWLGFATTGGVSGERGALAATRVRDGCDPSTHPQRGGVGRRRVGAVPFSLVVRVLRRVERQGGFRGA